MTESDQDIRAKALLDQIDEIDKRILGVPTPPLTKTQKVVRLGLYGAIVILPALAATRLDRLGFGMTLLISALLLVSFNPGPWIRPFQRRKLNRERARVYALYEEIDRRLRLNADSSEEGREQ